MSETEQAAMEILTPDSPRWNEFTAALFAVGVMGLCDGDRGKHVHRYAKAVMAKMDNVDVAGTLAFFEDHGGYCDCEILVNVDPHWRWAADGDPTEELLSPTVKESDDAFKCLDCAGDTLEMNEYYVVHDTVWLKANPLNNGMLCIGCLEGRLGRTVYKGDFINCPLNKRFTDQSSRLRSRLRLRGAGQVNVYKTHPRSPTKQPSMFEFVEFQAVQRRLDEHDGDVMPAVSSCNLSLGHRRRG